MSCGAGRFESGKFVYEPWLDGQGDRLVRLGVLSAAGSVDDDQVPEVDGTVGDPFWLGGVVGGEPSADDATDETEATDEDEDVVFDPSKVNGSDVTAYVEEHPDQLVAVLAAEQAGKARVGVIRELTARIEALEEEEVQ